MAVYKFVARAVKPSPSFEFHIQVSCKVTTSLLTFIESSGPLHHKQETWPSLCLVWPLPQHAAALPATTSPLFSASSTIPSMKSLVPHVTLDAPLLLALM